MKSELGLDFADCLAKLAGWATSCLSLCMGASIRPFLMRVFRGAGFCPATSSGDYSLRPLAARLEALDYRTFFPGFGTMWTALHTLPRLETVLRKANYKTHAKVVVIGRSLGGIYARELALPVSQSG